MTPAEKPQTVDSQAGKADENTPATAGASTGSEPVGASSQESNGQSVAESAAGSTAGSTKETKPAATPPSSSDQPTEPEAPTTNARTARPDAKTTEMRKPTDDLTGSSPPPWQRVASDTRYTQDHEEATGHEPNPRFEEWGYQRSPRSESYPSAPPSVALGGYSSMAPASPFPAASGQQAGDPSGRTTVNFGTPPGGARPSTPTPSALRRPGRGPRRASLQVKRVDPWSVLKLAFVLSVALFFVWLVAVGVLYGVLDGMGVWDKLNGTYVEFAQNTSAANGPLITAGRVFGIAAVIGAINIVLFTALATVGAFVYNVSADLAGGLEITLAERE